jgi:hypothetical protein
MLYVYSSILSGSTVAMDDGTCEFFFRLFFVSHGATALHSIHSAAMSDVARRTCTEIHILCALNKTSCYECSFLIADIEFNARHITK